MINILGINISSLDRSELDSRLDFFLNGTSGHYLVTPNPEIILLSQKDEEYFYILNHADIAIADGFGLYLAGRLAHEKLPRLTGSDLTLELLAKAVKNNWPVGILNWRYGLSDASLIKKICLERWPGLKMMVLDIDRKLSLTIDEEKKLLDFAPRLLFVGLGAPWQEKIIYHNLKNWPSVHLALGIGGTFDFITGRTKRAPQIMRHWGLEWLYRLLIQPTNRLKRLQRIWNATAVFSWKIFRWRFIQPHRYRANVAVWLYKKVGAEYNVLLVERENWPGHWQLPQGGTDGEDLMTAGARELSEELNVNTFVGQASFKNLYLYDFFQEHRDSRGAKNSLYGYKGQRQSLYIAKFNGDDQKIKVNFWDHSAWKWVSLDRFLTELHPIRRPAGKIYLERFNKFIKEKYEPSS